MLLKHSFIGKNYSSNLFKRTKSMNNKAKEYKKHFFDSGVKYEHKQTLIVCSETTLIFGNRIFLFKTYAQNTVVTKISPPNSIN